MTLAAQLTADRGVWLDTDGFAESITHYPLGVVAGGVAITAIVDLDDEQGEVVSDGQGERVVRRGRLEVSSALTIAANERHQGRDTFLIGSQLWQAVGIEGRDAAFLTVLIRREEPISTKQGRPTK